MSSPLKQEEYEVRIANLYLAQCLNFLQYATIISKIFVFKNKADFQILSALEFFNGNTFAFVSLDCFFPS